MHKIIALLLAIVSILIAYYVRHVGYITDGNYVADGEILADEFSLSFKEMISIFDGNISYHYSIEGINCSYQADLYSFGSIERYGKSTVNVDFDKKNFRATGDCSKKIDDVLLPVMNNEFKAEVISVRKDEFCVDIDSGPVTCYRKIK